MSLLFVRVLCGNVGFRSMKPRVGQAFVRWDILLSEKRASFFEDRLL